MTAEPAPTPETPEWLKYRQKFVGASDVAGMLGLSMYKTPRDVYDSKFGEPEQIENKNMNRGKVLEASVLRAYEMQTGWNIEPSRHCTHPEHEFMAATPDGFVDDPNRGEGLVEAKTAFIHTKDSWGEEGTNDIPIDYLSQCTHQMAVTGKKYVDIVVLFADETAFDLLVAMRSDLNTNVDKVAALILNMDFRIYHMDRDLEIEADLIAEEKKFWNDHVLAKTPPPDLAKMEPDGKVRQATEEEYELMLTARDAYQADRTAGKKMLNAKRKLQLAIGGDSGIYDARVGKATWTRNKPKTEKNVDWEAVALGLMDQARFNYPISQDDFEELKSVHTKTETTQGDRQLTLPWSRWRRDALPAWLGGTK